MCMRANCRSSQLPFSTASVTWGRARSSAHRWLNWRKALMESRQTPNKRSYNDLVRYSSIGTQIFAALGIAVFIGLKVDKWLKISAPLLVIILPVLVLSGIIYKIVKE